MSNFLSKTEFDDFKFKMLLFKGMVESEIGNHNTIGNIRRNMKGVEESLNMHSSLTAQMNEMISQLRIDMAVHEVKLARSGAFYGAVSGIVIAIVTTLMINFAISSTDKALNTVVYKEDDVEHNRLQLKLIDE